jgi:hypothetical protein
VFGSVGGRIVRTIGIVRAKAKIGRKGRAFVGIDTSKLRNAVAVAEKGRGGTFAISARSTPTEAATRKLVTKLAAKYRQLWFCYEAGPDGIRALSADQEAWPRLPSLIPKNPGDRVKTNRRDAVSNPRIRV